MTALRHPGNSSRAADNDLCSLTERRNDAIGPVRVFVDLDRIDRKLLGELLRRKGAAIVEFGDCQNPVSVEKDCARPALAHHLVLCVCSTGCETRQCQTTACIPSESGVTRSGSTGGMTITTSP